MEGLYASCAVVSRYIWYVYIWSVCAMALLRYVGLFGNVYRALLKVYVETNGGFVRLLRCGEYGVATFSRLLKNIGLFCKRAL